MSIAAELMRQLSWDPPGPGTWNLDKVHVPRPATAHMQETIPAFSDGFGESAVAYGWLVGRFDISTVNGFMYSSIKLADFDEFPARFAKCEEAFATKQWRAEVERWDTVAKPAAIELHRALLAVDPDELATDDLVDYLRRCRDHHAAMWRQHHRFNGTHMIPVGDFVVSTSAWTGLPTNEIAALLRGASPISRGWSAEADALATAIRATPGAVDIVHDTVPADEVLDRLRATSDEIARALDEWLLLTGHRPVDGFDVSDPIGVELPSMMVQCIRATLTHDEPVVSAEEIDRVRQRVPAPERDEFDSRLAEARFTYRIRDERGIYSDALACGIARRAMLAAGRRLAATSRLPSPELAIEASIEELGALLTSPDPSLVEALEARLTYRTAVTVADAPEFLGDPPAGPPSLDGLPPAVMRMMSALIGINDTGSRGAPGATAVDAAGDRVLSGHAANSGTHTGVARIVASPDDFHRLQDGDVLVTITTGEAFNVAIAMVGALVTDQGHLMSHAAITAREFGIPAVVGTGSATTQIPDGAVVEVDGTAGTVRWS